MVNLGKLRIIMIFGIISAKIFVNYLFVCLFIKNAVCKRSF